MRVEVLLKSLIELPLKQTHRGLTGVQRVLVHFLRRGDPDAAQVVAIQRKVALPQPRIEAAKISDELADVRLVLEEGDRATEASRSQRRGFQKLVLLEQIDLSSQFFVFGCDGVEHRAQCRSAFRHRPIRHRTVSEGA